MSAIDLDSPPSQRRPTAIPSNTQIPLVLAITIITIAYFEDRNDPENDKKPKPREKESVDPWHTEASTYYYPIQFNIREAFQDKAIQFRSPTLDEILDGISSSYYEFEKSPNMWYGNPGAKKKEMNPKMLIESIRASNLIYWPIANMRIGLELKHFIGEKPIYETRTSQGGFGSEDVNAPPIRIVKTLKHVYDAREEMFF